MAFEIHTRLASSGYEIGTLCGCRLILKDNSLFPWFLVVPEVEGVEDPHQLPAERYHEIMEVQRLVCEFISAHFRPEKLNTGCIGNQVRQLHLHLIGRSTGDPAWPGTVWAFSGKKAYTAEEAGEIVTAARTSLGISFS